MSRSYSHKRPVFSVEVVDSCTAIVPLLIPFLNRMTSLPCTYLLGEREYTLKCYTLEREYEVKSQYCIV